MPNEGNDAFIPIKDEHGKVTGMMDRTTADYLASTSPDPNQASLDVLLSRITRVRVVPFATFVKGTTDKTTLLDTSDPAALESFRRCFAILENPETFGHCMCMGDPHIELYAGPELAATLGYHHGFAIRWEAWKNDAVLKQPDLLLDWLSAHGVDGPRQEVQEMIRRGEESERRAEQWLQSMPECLRPIWEQMDSEHDPELHRRLLDALRTAVSSPEGQVLALLGWFGSGAGPWNGYPSCERIPELLLGHYPASVVVQTLMDQFPTPAQWVGAARYFALVEFRRARKGEESILPPELKRRLLEAGRSTGIPDNIERAVSAFSQ